MAVDLPNWRGLPVVVLGDVMLDRFVRGEVRRISPEAPIPVVEVSDETAALGGAANVAHNLKALGASPVLIGVVGEDPAGEHLLDTLVSRGIETSGIVRDASRGTTVKTRILAQGQQIVRVDRENRVPVGESTAERLMFRLMEYLHEAPALMVSDYAKGVLTSEILKYIGAACRDRGIPMVADPKPVHFPYPGATVVTPNRGETAAMAGRAFEPAEVETVARGLLERTDWDAVLVTLGEEGMALCERDGDLHRIPARVREVYDVTGAGDTVAAVLTLALAAGESLRRGAEIANAAAGLVVGKVGTAICTPEELAGVLTSAETP